MKKLKSLSLLFILISLISSGIFAQQPVTVKGMILNNVDFKNVKLDLAYGKNVPQFGVAEVAADGSFILSAKIPQHDIYRLVFNDKNAVLIALAPQEKVEITLDANNLQQIPAVKGSPSMTFVKQVIDVVMDKNLYLDSVNKALQNDPSQKYFNSFIQKFNLYNQTNQDVDRYLKNVYQTASELYEIVKSNKDDKGEIPTKTMDKFLEVSIEKLKIIKENYFPFANYLNNVDAHYDFTSDRAPGNKELFGKLDRYIDNLGSRYFLAQMDLTPLNKMATQMVDVYDSLTLNKSIENKKVKKNFCNDLLNALSQYLPNPNNYAQYEEKAETSNLLAKEIMSESQKVVSAIVKEFQELYNEGDKFRNDQIMKLMQQNKSDIAVLMFLDNYVGRDRNPVLYDEVVKALAVKYPENPLVMQKMKEIEAATGPLAIGSVAPDMEYDNPEGKKMKLSDLRGKVVLIDFWASWCRPCRNENPNVVKLYQKYQAKGFDIYSVSLDRDKTSWINAIKSDNLTWENHVSDLKYWSSAGAKQYNVSSIPSTFLLDREGRIIAKNLRGAALEQKLQEILGE